MCAGVTSLGERGSLGMCLGQKYIMIRAGGQIKTDLDEDMSLTDRLKEL